MSDPADNPRPVDLGAVLACLAEYSGPAFMAEPQNPPRTLSEVHSTVLGWTWAEILAAARAFGQAGGGGQ